MPSLFINCGIMIVTLGVQKQRQEGLLQEHGVDLDSKHGARCLMISSQPTAQFRRFQDERAHRSSGELLNFTDSFRCWEGIMLEMRRSSIRMDPDWMPALVGMSFGESRALHFSFFDGICVIAGPERQMLHIHKASRFVFKYRHADYCLLLKSSAENAHLAATSTDRSSARTSLNQFFFSVAYWHIMATIKSLLNPLVDTAEQNNNSMDSKDETSAVDSDAGLGSDALEDARGKPSRKKQKISKDAAVFNAGPIRGECRYPPHEEHDDFLAAKHEVFNIYPVGNIATYARHIPYNSEKKLFLEKTGREYFEGMEILR